MSTIRWTRPIAFVASIAAATACSSARDVEVAGELSGDPTLAADPIRVEFYESADEDGKQTLTLVDSITVEALGSFEATVPVESDTLHVIAIVDRDGNEACTDGEPWGGADATVDPENKATVKVVIRKAAKCSDMLPATE